MSTIQRARKPVERKFFVRRQRRRMNFKSSDSKMAVTIAKSALRQVRRLNRNIEKKMITSTTLSTNVDSTGIVVLETPVAQGDDFFERGGNKMTVTSFAVNGTLFAISAIPETVRIIFFYDTRQVSDSTPAVGAVLRTSDPLSFMNETSIGRFRILYDRLFAFDASNDAGVAVRFERKLNLQQRYNGTASTDQEKNMIFMLAISTATANHPIFRHIAQLRFTDS